MNPTKTYQERKKYTPTSGNSRPNKTGFKGVVKHGSRYQANIQLKIVGKVIAKSLGTFDSPAEAYQARVEFIKSLL